MKKKSDEKKYVGWILIDLQRYQKSWDAAWLRQRITCLMTIYFQFISSGVCKLSLISIALFVFPINTFDEFLFDFVRHKRTVYRCVFEFRFVCSAEIYSN